MIRRSGLVALAVVAAVNVAVLAGVARNRAGTPDATVVLDERELEMVSLEREQTGRQLRLRYQNAFSTEDPRPASLQDAIAPRFVERAELEALGFDCSVAPGNETAAAFYQIVLHRPAFVVFSIGGPAWDERVAAWQARSRQRIDEEIARGELSGESLEQARAEVDAAPQRLSRLMPIAVGPDADVLRADHPDRQSTIILPGVVRLHHIGPTDPGGPSLQGHLVQLYPVVLDVPRDRRAPLDALPEPPALRPPGRAPNRGFAMLDRSPRYEATISVGRRLQPWVVEIRRRQP